MNLKNEKGLTLVEVLATLVLFSIIAITIWNFFFQTINHNEREVTQNQLQREANLIVNTIQNFHTKYTITEISNVNNDLESYIQIEAYDKENGKAIPPTKFENSDIKYEVSSGTFTADLTNPKYEFIFQFKLTSKNNDKIYYEGQTIFSKLMGNNN